MDFIANKDIDNKQYIARIVDGREESVAKHSIDTANIAEQNAPEFLKSTARLTALLHDAGKNCDEFLTYIKKAAEDQNSVRPGSVTHSTAGAIIANDLSGSEKPDIFTAEIIRHAILSHHGIYDSVTPEGKVIFNLRNDKQQGLEDICGEVYRYLPRDELEVHFRHSVVEVTKSVNGISELTKGKKVGSKSFYWGLLERLLLSLLIDADRTVSACFAKNVAPEPITQQAENFWDEQIKKLESHLSYKASDTPIAQIRHEISSSCKEAGGNTGEILRLVVPTGAGKTFSSLRFALYQAKCFDKKRIIYVAPFNSILEQNSMEFRKALDDPGMEVILEHHSNLIPDDTEKYKDLTQNWNAPIVLTSAVQFLNALFSAKSGSIRRMHSLTNSVIIVDEVQSIPIRCTALFNLATNFLAYICGSSIVLCSATQPPFEDLPDNRLILPVDILTNSTRYHDAFRRTRIIDKTAMVPGGMDTQTAVEFIINTQKTEPSILFIVNTKKCATTIFDELKNRISGYLDAPQLFHLSTNMCPMHRRRTLDKIRALLENDKPVVCVSTQLIEAGVDISLKAVIRSAAGLQNVIQSAGRCNRNAEITCGNVYIVKLADSLEDLSNLPEIRETQNAFYSAVAGLQDKELDSTEAMAVYYKHYFYGKEQILCYPDPKSGVSLVDLLSNNPVGVNRLREKGYQPPFLVQAFKTAGDHFQVIEDKDAVDILVEYDNRSADLIKQLNSNPDRLELENLLPQLQPYTVSISRTMLKSLGNAVYIAQNCDILILQKQYYHLETGISEMPSQMDYYQI